VAYVDGVADHRVVDGRKLPLALQEQRCWICGETLGRQYAFLLGPMCIISRTISEPPSHKECAEYAARACPFLTRPHAHRREAGKPEAAQPAAGMALQRNPGVICLWMTRSFHTFPAYAGQQGLLVRVGEATATHWYCAGRDATRAEVLDSLESGLPLLYEEARKGGDEGARALALALGRALQYLPPHAEGERTPQEVTPCP
jgi:hypothetical protein